MGHSLGGGVGPMRCAKGVVDINVPKLGQRLSEGGIVSLFLLVKAQVLQKKDLPGLKLRSEGLDLRSDAV